MVGRRYWSYFPWSNCACFRVPSDWLDFEAHYELHWMSFHTFDCVGWCRCFLLADALFARIGYIRIPRRTHLDDDFHSSSYLRLSFQLWLLRLQKAARQNYVVSLPGFGNLRRSYCRLLFLRFQTWRVWRSNSSSSFMGHVHLVWQHCLSNRPRCSCHYVEKRGRIQTFDHSNRRRKFT